MFCFRHPRRLAGDGTVTIGGRSLMVVGRRPGPAGRCQVVVQEHLDGSYWIELGGQRLPVVPAPERPAVVRELPARPPSRTTGHPVRPDHPWHRYPAVNPR